MKVRLEFVAGDADGRPVFVGDLPRFWTGDIPPAQWPDEEDENDDRFDHLRAFGPAWWAQWPMTYEVIAQSI